MNKTTEREKWGDGGEYPCDWHWAIFRWRRVQEAKRGMWKMGLFQNSEPPYLLETHGGNEGGG